MPYGLTWVLHQSFLSDNRSLYKYKFTEKRNFAKFHPPMPFSLAWGSNQILADGAWKEKEEENGNTIFGPNFAIFLSPRTFIFRWNFEAR